MGKQDRAECPHCHDGIALSQVARHILRCERLTPEQRLAHITYRKQAIAAYYRDKAQPPKRAHHAANGDRPTGPSIPLGEIHEPRVQLVVSLDLKTLRELLLQLAPSFSLDKVSLL